MTAPSDEDQREVSHAHLEKAVWIDWGRHLRTRSLTERLGTPLEVIAVAGGHARRYLRSILETMRVIRERRPRVVFATNPSIVLGYLLLILRLRYRFVLVSDAHYVGVQSITGGPVVQALLDFYNRRVDLVIVTNPGHAERLRGIGARPTICPDPLPRIDHPQIPELDLLGKSVFLICSFDADEPFEEVFEAIRTLQEEDFTLYVSGNYRKSGIDPEQYPGVEFLGYVDDATYVAHLRTADVVMDLTRMENCLVCGAYEALVEARPLILSGSEASRSYFRDACEYTANDAKAIAEAIRTTYDRRADFSAAAGRWAVANEREMDQRVASLVDEVQTLVH